MYWIIVVYAFREDSGVFFLVVNEVFLRDRFFGVVGWVWWFFN